MSDFVTRLVQRQLGALSTVEPKLPSPFESITSAAPMPMMKAPAVADTGLPLSANPPARQSETALSAVSARQANAPQSVSKLTESSLKELREALPIAARTAPETKVPAHDSASAPRQNAAAMAPQRWPSFEAQRAAPGSFAENGLPVVTQAVAAAAPPPERNSAREQNHAEHPRPAPLVEARIPSETNAPPRLETKTNHGVAGVRAAAAADAAAPIQVTIGRIEVTAVTQSTPPKRALAPRKPAMSLDDYLARRQRSER